MPYDKRSRGRAASCRSLTGDHSMNPGHGLRVLSGAGFALVDPSTMSGVDRKVSIRITLATSLTRVWATAASGDNRRLDRRRQPAAVSAAGHVPSGQLTTFVLIADQIR